MNNDQPTEDLASVLFHATSASKLLAHAIQQRVHAERIKNAFISPDGRNAFLDTYCCGIRDSWNKSRNKAESTEVLSLKAYCQIGRNIWTGFTSGYDHDDHPSYLLYYTDRKNYPPQQSATSLPVNSLLSSLDRQCHVMQFRLSREARTINVVVNTPLFLDVLVPMTHRNDSSTHSSSKSSSKWTSVNRRSEEDDSSGSAFYSATTVLAKLSRFMDHDVASDAFDKLLMTNGELVSLLDQHIHDRQFLKTSLECAGPIKETAGHDLVTTTIVWPPLTAFSVIGMLYSAQPLCRNAIGFFASALPKLIPVCQTVAASLRPWESDGEQILAEIRKDDLPMDINFTYVVSYWNYLWNKWQAHYPSGPSESNKEIVASFSELFVAIDNDNESHLTKAKRAVISAIKRLESKSRLRYRYVLVNPRRAKTHSLSISEV